MDYRNKRQQIATALAENPADALQLALELVASEPNESVNYKNLAICYAYDGQVTKAKATLNLGEKKTKAKRWFWDTTRAGILADCGLITELTTLIVEISTSTDVRDTEKLGLIRTFSDRLDPAILKGAISYLKQHLDANSPLVAEFVYVQYTHEDWDAVNLFLDGFKGDKSLDYEGKKRLSIVCNQGNLTKRAKALLEDMISKPPNQTTLQDDLLELAKVFAKSGDVDESVNCLDRVLSVNQRNIEALRAKAFYLYYSDKVDTAKIKSASLQFGDILRENITETFSCKKDSSQPIKIGFLSASFSMHPVGWMTAGFFCEAPNFASDAEVHIICTRWKEDFVAKTIKFSGNIFHDLSDLADDEIGNFIHELNLNILVDLEGLGLHSHAGQIIKKPAPILIKWVGGLIGSMWLPEYDYLITDKYQTPPGSEHDFSEELITLPSSYVTYTPPPYKIQQHEPPHTAKGLITFGSFNNATKISNLCIELWASILNQVDRSVLVFKDKSLGDRGIQEIVLEKFKAVGIDGTRIGFWLPTEHKEHLEHLKMVDIALDTIPYTGGLTTVESLYMGVPVVGLSGRLLCHRHSTSHLTITGHEELVAASVEEYVQIAVDLAKDSGRIRKYRRKLRQDLIDSPLLEHKKFTSDLIQKMAALVS